MDLFLESHISQQINLGSTIHKNLKTGLFFKDPTYPLFQPTYISLHEFGKETFSKIYLKTTLQTC